MKQKYCPSCGTMKDATTANFYRSKREGDDGFRTRCKSCEREARLQRGGEVPTPKQNKPEGRTEVLCSCGHTYNFNTQDPKFIDVLKGKPCPPCQANVKVDENKKNENVPEKKPRRKVDKSWVDSVMEFIPAALFHSVLPDLIMAVRAGLAVWLQGPPGTSKSTLAEQAAKGLDMDYYYVSCHEFMTRSDLFGFTDANGTDHRTPLWEAFENGGLLLLDEIDNGNPNLLAALNSALSNGHCVFGSGTMVERHPDFRVVATANTAGLGPEHGYIGRNGVDLATRDRFVTFQVPIDDALEVALAELYIGSDVEVLYPEFVDAARKRLEKRSLGHEDANAAQVIDVVRQLRALVDSRFRGSVVSPRTTIHAAAMVAAGFTLREALEAKLPGIKPADVTQLMKEVTFQ